MFEKKKKKVPLYFFSACHLRWLAVLSYSLRITQFNRFSLVLILCYKMIGKYSQQKTELGKLSYLRGKKEKTRRPKIPEFKDKNEEYTNIKRVFLVSFFF